MRAGELTPEEGRRLLDMLDLINEAGPSPRAYVLVLKGVLARLIRTLAEDQRP